MVAPNIKRRREASRQAQAAEAEQELQNVAEAEVYEAPAVVEEVKAEPKKVAKKSSRKSSSVKRG